MNILFNRACKQAGLLKARSIKPILLFCAAILVMGLKAQNSVEKPLEKYAVIQFEVDPYGSADKKGLNSVLTFSMLRKKHLELGLGMQTIFTNKYSQNIELDYLDAQLQFQYLLNAGNRVQFLGGMHGGYLYRPGISYGIWGFIGTFRWWWFKNRKLALVVSAAYDYREFNEFRLNSRGGLTYRF